MIKKIIYILSVILLISATAWFIRRDLNLRSSDDLNILRSSDDPNVGTSSENIIEGDAKIEIINIQEEFQNQALEIIKRPIIFKSDFPTEIKTKIGKDINDIYTAAKINYDNLNQWIYLGQLRKVIGDYEGARDAWEFASLIRPPNPISFYNLGDLYGLYLKDFPKSEFNYLKSIENDSQNIPAYLNLADIYWYSYKEKQKEIPNLLLSGLKVNLESENKLPLLSRLQKYYSDIGDSQNAQKYQEEINRLSN